MKIDDKTIAVLSNFQTINTSIAIDKGNLLKIVSESDTIFAQAEVPFEFPEDIAIYDLSKFLALLSLSKENEITFHKGYMLVRQGASTVRYWLCDRKLLKECPSKIKMPEPEIKFNLTWATLSATIKAMQILKLSEISISGDGENLMLSAVDAQNPESTTYSTVICPCKARFNCIIEAEKLKMVAADYFVSISSKGIAHFKPDSGIQYWVILNGKSKFER